MAAGKDYENKNAFSFLSADTLVGYSDLFHLSEEDCNRVLSVIENEEVSNPEVLNPATPADIVLLQDKLCKDVETLDRLLTDISWIKAELVKFFKTKNASGRDSTSTAATYPMLLQNSTKSETTSKRRARVLSHSYVHPFDIMY